MKVETGGHDTPGFRAISALLLDEIPAGAWSVGGRFDARPSAIVEIRVPEGALDDERRAPGGIISLQGGGIIQESLGAIIPLQTGGFAGIRSYGFAPWTSPREAVRVSRFG
ncbi:MAG TPA: hypothetical protein VGL12_09875 [Roseiarcus sp.]